MCGVRKECCVWGTEGRAALPRSPPKEVAYDEEMGESAYSYSLTTFSPSGKLVQIEYALNAVTKAPTSLGIKGGQVAP